MFINDHALSPAASLAQLEPGWFYRDPQTGAVWFADDPTGQIVEYSSAASAFAGTAENVTIRNIVVEKYATSAQWGAIDCQKTANWVIENTDLRLNAGTGAALCSGARLRRSEIHHNGQLGIGGQGSDIVIEDNAIWANNTYGFSTKWEAGGVKLFSSRDTSIRGNHVFDNDGPGVWCDTDCRHVVYFGNVVEDNQGAGIFHEISYAATIQDNILQNNGRANTQWYWGNDILIAGSQDVVVSGNAIRSGSGKCSVLLADQNRSSDSGLRYKTRNNRVVSNEIWFKGVPCSGGVSDSGPGDENFGIITGGNNLFDRNLYHVAAGTPFKRFVWGRKDYVWDQLPALGLEQNGRLIVDR